MTLCLWAESSKWTNSEQSNERTWFCKFFKRHLKQCKTLSVSNSKHNSRYSSIGRMSVSKTEDEGSSPYTGAMTLSSVVEHQKVLSSNLRESATRKIKQPIGMAISLENWVSVNNWVGVGSSVFRLLNGVFSLCGKILHCEWRECGFKSPMTPKHLILRNNVKVT